MQDQLFRQAQQATPGGGVLGSMARAGRAAIPAKSSPGSVGSSGNGAAGDHGNGGAGGGANGQSFRTAGAGTAGSTMDIGPTGTAVLDALGISNERVAESAQTARNGAGGLRSADLVDWLRGSDAIGWPGVDNGES